jgi:hypothetical protein
VTSPSLRFAEQRSTSYNGCRAALKPRDAHQARPVSALRQLITGVVAEKVAMEVSAKRVPQRERDIEALNGQEFGKNSVGARTKQEPAA